MVGSLMNGSGSSKLYLWAGRIFTALPILALLASGIGKVTLQTPLVEAMTQKFGFAESAILPIGVVEILCALIYAIPRTSALGAVLMTGYLGGAVVTHVRVAEAFIVPLLLGVFAWAGLYCRDERIRGLLPLRR